MINIDHFILGIDDLEKGMEEFYQKTGVQPVFGGVHEGAGTHNALVSLGHGMYLEILAPREKGAETAWGKIDCKELKPIGWVLSTNYSEQVVSLMKAFNVPNSGIVPLSRKKSDGKLLRWKNVFHDFYGNRSLNPFFIEWDKDVVHPSETTPEGCSLNSFELDLDEDNELISFLKSLDVELRFNSKGADESGRLKCLELKTPKGNLTIG